MNLKQLEQRVRDLVLQGKGQILAVDKDGNEIEIIEHLTIKTDAHSKLQDIVVIR